MKNDLTVHQKLENPLTEGQLARLESAGRDQDGINEIAEIVRQVPEVDANSIVAFASLGVAPGTIGAALAAWHDAGLDGDDPMTSPENLIILAEIMGVHPTTINLPKGQVMLGGRNVSLRQAMDEGFGELAETFGLELNSDSLALPGGSGSAKPTANSAPDVTKQTGTEAQRSFEGASFTTASEEMFLVVVEFIRDQVPEDYVSVERDPVNVFMQVALEHYGDIRDAYRVIAADEDEAEALSILFKRALNGSADATSVLRPEVTDEDDDDIPHDDDDVSLDQLRDVELGEDS